VSLFCIEAHESAVLDFFGLPVNLPRFCPYTGKSIMKQIGKILSKIINGLTYITGWTAAISLVAAAITVTEAVIVRKIFGVSTVWQIEASVFLLIFTVFVGAPFVQKNEHHLNVDLVIIHLSPRTREITLIIVSIISCLLAALLAWYAWPMWWESVVNNDHSESLWGPPLWIPYLFLPLGMTLLFLQYIIYIHEKITALRRGEIVEEAERFELKGIDVSDSELDPEES
jgi:TRAP-type C4-dicarboxylate transport system permease small subunit